MSRGFLLVLPALLGVLAACGSVEASKLPSGGYRITCDKGMSDCVSRAEKICAGRGYTILGGKNHTRVLGGSSSNYQAPIFIGLLEVVCGEVSLAHQECKQPAQDEKEVHTLGSSSSKDADGSGERVCAPGASHACVGPGGCSGGQSCLPDGSGYGPCDCGGGTQDSAPAPVGTGSLPGGSERRQENPPQIGLPPAEPLSSTP